MLTTQALGSVYDVARKKEERENRMEECKEEITQICGMEDWRTKKENK
jgi:hypothetical protein